MKEGLKWSEGNGSSAVALGRSMGGIRPRRSRMVAYFLVPVLVSLFLASALINPGCGCQPIPSHQEEVSFEHRVEKTSGTQPQVTEGHYASAELEREKKERISYFRERSRELALMVHARINDIRTRHGLDTLAWDDLLAGIALEHSRDMATRNYFDHVSPEGKDFADRYREHGYSRTTRVGDVVYQGGENLFLGNVVKSYTYDKKTGEILSFSYFTLESLADTAVEGWMESPGHRENILTPFSREGIGVWVDDDGEVYITQNFS